MSNDENKLEILKKVENGTLSIEEGADLLTILDRAQEKQSAAENTVSVSSSNANPLPKTPFYVPAFWKAIWGVFLWLGIAGMALSGLWLFSSYNKTGMGWGFWFALFFLLLSVVIVFLGWRLLDGHWMLLKVHSLDENKKVFIYVPLPLQFAIWVFHTFGSYMPARVQNRLYRKKTRKDKLNFC